MSNSLIPVPNQVGTNLQTFQNSVSGSLVHAEAIVIVDSSGTERGTVANPVKVDGSANTQPISGSVTVSGSVGLTAGQSIELLDSGGTNKASISAAGALKVDNSGVTQPVSATSLPFASGNGSLLSGQGSTTASAAALAANACKKVTLKANTANALTIFVGPSGVTTSTGLALDPGESVVLEVSNTNLIFTIASSTGSGYSWIAVN